MRRLCGPANAAFKQVQVLGPAHRRDQQMDVMQLPGICLLQRPREKVRLLLIIPLQHHAVARDDQHLQRLQQMFGRKLDTIHKMPPAHKLRQAPLFLFLATRPLYRLVGKIHFAISLPCDDLLDSMKPHLYNLFFYSLS
jgi:hypothetical protein